MTSPIKFQLKKEKCQNLLNAWYLLDTFFHLWGIIINIFIYKEKVKFREFNWPNIKKLISGEPGMQTQVCLLLKPMPFPTLYSSGNL